uniref:KATNB1-like protein 1 n=1 Tax=Styela clava TaxID=7725 RepID=UPI00193AD7A1|nr:KATNB1-like protein 1 [Styela clava]
MDYSKPDSACLLITENHQKMIDILESRKIKLNAALSFWKNEDIQQLVTFLLRTNDDSLFVDVIPHLASSIRENNAIGKKVTLGICVELLPVLQRLLKTKFEDYVVASLDFMRIMSQNWYMELRELKQKGEGDKNHSMSLPQIYLELINMQVIIKKLCRRTGKIGDKAKVLFDILEQLT